MTWGEAIRLTRILMADPGSCVAASEMGWDHPVSREWMVAAHHFDLAHNALWKQGGGKGAPPKPYPRPYVAEGSQRRRGTPMSPERLKAVLAAHRAEGGG